MHLPRWSEADGERSRRRMLDCIEENPGIHLSELSRRTGRSVNNVKYNLERLKGAGLVCTSAGLWTHRAYPMRRLADRIYYTVCMNPGIKLSSLSDILQAEPEEVGYQARMLAERQKLAIETGGGKVRYRPLNPPFPGTLPNPRS